jgi:hypothetical protein
MGTTNHAFDLPQLGADADTWGAKLNAALSSIDQRMPSLTGKRANDTTALAFTGRQRFAAGSSAGASITLPHGAAPTAPDNGDLWSTTTTLNFRLNGATRSVAFLEGATFSGKLVCTPGAIAGLNIGQGATPSTLANGDLWIEPTGLYARVAGSTVGPFSAAGSAASAAKWTTARTLSFTGDVTGSGSVDGSQNVATALSLAGGSVSTGKIADAAVTLAKLANLAQATVIGRGAGDGTGAPVALNGASLGAMVTGIDLSQQSIGTAGSGYYKIGPLYVMFGISTSALNEQTTTISLPHGFTTLLCALATARNPSSADDVNNHVQYVTSNGAVPNVTFYQNTHTSSGGVSGFYWLVLAV